MVSTFEQERRELRESILESMRAADRDPDRAAACAYLLNHVEEIGPVPVRSARPRGFATPTRVPRIHAALVTG